MWNLYSTSWSLYSALCRQQKHKQIVGLWSMWAAIFQLTGKELNFLGKCVLQILPIVITLYTGGHLLTRKTQNQMRRRAFWKDWREDVRRCCEICQKCICYRLLGEFFTKDDCWDPLGASRQGFNMEASAIQTGQLLHSGQCWLRYQAGWCFTQ